MSQIRKQKYREVRNFPKAKVVGLGLEPGQLASRARVLKLQPLPPARLSAEVPASLAGTHLAQATWSHRMEPSGLTSNWEHLLLLWGLEAAKETFKGPGRDA